jgi:hypothetical protein
LEGLWKQRLGSRKKSENQRGHCGRRDLVFTSPKCKIYLGKVPLQKRKNAIKTL